MFLPPGVNDVWGRGCPVKGTHLRLAGVSRASLSENKRETCKNDPLRKQPKNHRSPKNFSSKATSRVGLRHRRALHAKRTQVNLQQEDIGGINSGRMWFYMKIWLDLAVADRIPNAYARSAEENLNLAGQNLGNLVFRKALGSIIKNLKDFQCFRLGDITESIAAQAELVIVSCANWLEMSEKAEKRNLYRALVIESFSCPVIAIGLGLQAKISQEVKLGPNSIRLAKALSKQSNTISVRDHNT